jgi:hypothetical protein
MNWNNNKPPFRRNNNKTPWNAKNRCSLCGLRNHTATNCQNIRDDKGNKIGMFITHGTCSKCPSYIRPRLHHQEQLCPYRPGGPLAKKN